jgi:hypothetical protein
MLVHTEANRGGSPKGKEGSKPSTDFPPSEFATDQARCIRRRFEACQLWAKRLIVVNWPELRIPRV